ncbi:sulfotransferase [Myxococcota bacterium]|nr:sulfotransferase [Myxococcota bacterium]
MGQTNFDPQSLDADSIIAEARERCGLENFGDESFQEPMRRMLDAYESEANLNENGRAAQRERTIGLLLNRLSLEDWLTRHPEIHDEELHVPVVVCGLPRTGTTMLHRLLASDPDTYAVLWYECRYPAPFPENDWTKDDGRIPAAKEEVRQLLEAVPELATVHPWDAEGPDEEIMLLENTFLSWMPESHANVPEFGRWVREQDRTQAYEYLKTLLRFLQWQKRAAGQEASSWVLKAPFHLGVVEVLLEAFPDTRIVQTHRDALETIPSICSLQLFLWQLASDEPDPHQVGRVWGSNWKHALRHALEMRNDRYPDRFVDIWYKDVATDPVGQVRKILEATNRTLSSEAEAEVLRWSQENRRENRPPHEYSMEKFGFNEDQLAADFREYRERFILSRTS